MSCSYSRRQTKILRRMTLKLKLEENNSEYSNYLWHDGNIIASGTKWEVKRKLKRLLNSGIKHIKLEIIRK